MEMRFSCIWTLLVFAGSAIVSSKDPKSVSLCGDSWLLTSHTYTNVSKVKATVPGQIHLDLFKAGIINESYYGFNQKEQVWVAQSEWWLSRQFQVSSELKAYQCIMLQCDGIDTVSEIEINSKATFNTTNMFRQYSFYVTSVLREGNNDILVKIQSPMKYSEGIEKAYPYHVPINGNYLNGSARSFIRKAQADFGWDWGPAFAPSGIWQYIGLIGFDVGLVTSVTPRVSYKDPMFKVSTYICATIPNNTKLPGQLHAIASLTSGPSGESIYPITSHGEFCAEVSFMVSKSSVKLWYPSGYGDPNTYNMSIQTTIKDSSGEQSLQSFEKTVGFRIAEVVTDDVPDGQTFYFRINDIPVFVKGSNFIPADAFHIRSTPDYLRRLVQTAKDANQNMLRVWGGGIYQSEAFYRACDELGIMVWQEFMFACSLYPRDTDFLENVAAEVKYQVLRLTHHPSIVLWSGNNENQGLAMQSGPLYVVDYSALYDEAVHRTLRSLNTGTPYWPASPSNGFLIDDPDRGLSIQRWGESGDTHYGDLHRYDYTDPCNDVSKFPKPRFASEFGLQSYPSIASWLEVSNSSMWGNDSPFMDWRQHHPGGNQQMLNLLKFYANPPNNPNKTRQFEDLVYMTQVIQMVCITAEIEHYRRSRNESYTMGTLYWQLNDVWQAQTWASVEYGGRWKLLHNGVKRSFDKLLVSPYMANGSVCAYAVSDDFENAFEDATLELTVHTWQGKPVNQMHRSNIKVDKLTSVEVFSEDVKTVFEGCPTPSQCFILLALMDSKGNSLAENAFVPSLVNASLEVAKFTIEEKHIDGKKAMFAITSDKVAPFVYLYTQVNGFFSDNGFLLMPSKSTAIVFTGYDTLDQLSFWKGLQVKTVSDTYQ